MSRVLEGRSVLRGEFHGTAAETIQTALDAFMDPPADGDGRTGAQRRADAFVRICEIALEHGTTAGRSKAHASFVIDWATLVEGVRGRMDGMFTGPIHQRDIERLLCSRHHHFLHRHPEWTITFEGQIVRVFRPNGQELERHPWAAPASRIDNLESWEPREPVGASP